MVVALASDNVVAGTRADLGALVTPAQPWNRSNSGWIEFILATLTAAEDAPLDALEGGVDLFELMALSTTEGGEEIFATSSGALVTT